MFMKKYWHSLFFLLVVNQKDLSAETLCQNSTEILSALNSLSVSLQKDYLLAERLYFGRNLLFQQVPFAHYAEIICMISCRRPLIFFFGRNGLFRLFLFFCRKNYFKFPVSLISVGARKSSFGRPLLLVDLSYLISRRLVLRRREVPGKEAAGTEHSRAKLVHLAIFLS